MGRVFARIILIVVALALVVGAALYASSAAEAPTLKDGSPLPISQQSSPAASPSVTTSPMLSQTPSPTVTTATPEPPASTPSAKPPKDTRTGAELDTPYQVNGIIVVSPKHPISKKYVPEMTKPNGLTAETKTAVNKMIAAAKKDGVVIKVRSGYRSYAEQAEILKRKIKEYGDEKKARRYNAEAGKSEHQTGLSVDLWDGKTWGDAIQNTKMGKWLWEHSREYGFILRYPPGKEKITGYIYEAWHFRYIGVEDSMKFKANTNKTLEEYLEIL